MQVFEFWLRQRLALRQQIENLAANHAGGTASISKFGNRIDYHFSRNSRRLRGTGNQPKRVSEQAVPG